MILSIGLTQTVTKMVKGFVSLPHEAHGHIPSKMMWFESTLLHHFGKLVKYWFLIGAMTTVEITTTLMDLLLLRILKQKRKYIYFGLCAYWHLFYLLS